MRVIIEVGGHSRWVSALLKELKHEVIVANPRRVLLIAENHNKNDETDAELLARLGRVDPQLLAPIKHRSDVIHADLALIRARAALVESRTALINSVRGQVKACGYRMPTCSAKCFGKRIEALPMPLKETLTPVMECIAKLTENIGHYDKQIKAMAEIKYPETAPLMQIVGVAAQTALTFILTLEDPTRFPRARSVGPLPRNDNTSKTERQSRPATANYQTRGPLYAKTSRPSGPLHHRPVWQGQCTETMGIGSRRTGR